jgi:hypothetical protein
MAIDHPELDREIVDVNTCFLVEAGCPVIIAAYAVAHKQAIVTCDKGFLHISTALKSGRK